MRYLESMGFRVYLLGLIVCCQAYLQAQQIQWSQMPEGSGDRQIDQIISFPNGDFIAAGTYTQLIQIGNQTFESIGATDCWIARFEANGTLIWAKSIGSKDNDAMSSIVRFGQDSCFIGIEFWDTLYIDALKIAPKIGSKAAAILSLDDQGSFIGKQILSSKGIKHLSQLTTNSEGELLACGHYSDTLWIDDQFLTGDATLQSFVFLRCPNTAKNWQQSLGISGQAKVESVQAIANGNIVLGGSFTGQIAVGNDTITAGTANGNVFWAAYNAPGQGLWVKRSKGVFETSIKGLEALSNGGFCLAGTFLSQIDFGNGFVLQSLPAFEDIFLSFFDQNGICTAAKSLGSRKNDKAFQVKAIGNEGFITGAFQDTLFVGNKTLIAQNQLPNGFVIYFDAEGNAKDLQLRSTDASLLNIQIALGAQDHLHVEAISGTGNLDVFGNPFSLQTATFDWLLLSYDLTSAVVDQNALRRISVFPNPAIEYFTTDLEDYQQIDLYRIDGRLVRSFGKSSKFQITDVSPGQYILVAKSNQGKITGYSSLIIVR